MNTLKKQFDEIYNQMKASTNAILLDETNHVTTEEQLCDRAYYVLRLHEEYNRLALLLDYKTIDNSCNTTCKRIYNKYKR